MNKQKIIRNFNKASLSYDEVANVQKKCAQILVSILVNKLNKFYPLSVLDVGSGTGYASQFLSSIFQNASYTLNDIADEMLNYSKIKFHNNSAFKFILGDFENLEFSYHDLIISNFALQWASELENTLKKLYYNSKVLAFSYPLNSTFKELNQIFPSSINKYPTESELKIFISSLTPSISHFSIRKFQIKFPEIKYFFTYLKKLGANSTGDNISLSYLKNVIKNQSQPFTITYEIFFAIIRRI